MNGDIKSSSQEKNLVKVKAASSLVTLKYNSSFCGKLVEKNKIASTIEEPSYFNEGSQNLVYDLSKSSNSNMEFFSTIIDLLLQLRAAQSDQNIFVQNNTVLREQILNQLKSEVLRVSHKLTKNQIKNLEVLSSNSFDEKTLTDILKSFLTSSKKKFQDDGLLKNTSYLESNTLLNSSIEKIIYNHAKVFSQIAEKREFLSKVLNKINFRKFLHTSSELRSINPKVSLADRESKEKLADKKFKPYATKKTFLESKKQLESLYDLLGDNIVSSSSLILPLIKLQTKLSEISILSKTKVTIRNIVNKAISKILPSEVELVNKVVEKSQINELKETLIYNQEQYEQYKAKYKSEIKHIQSQIKKLKVYNSVSSLKTYELKLNQILDVNARNAIRKNVFKLVSQDRVIQKIENVSESAVRNYVVKTLVHKSKVIDRIFENYRKRNIKNTSYNSKTIKHKIINLDEKILKDLSHEDVSVNVINRSHSEYTSLDKKLLEYTHYNIKNRHAKKINLNFQKLNLGESYLENYENEIAKLKNINYKFYKKLSTKSRTQVNEFLNFFVNNNSDRQVLFFDSISKGNRLIFNVSDVISKNRLHNKIQLLETNLEKTLDIQNLDLFKTKILKSIKEKEFLKNIHSVERLNNINKIIGMRSKNLLIKSYDELTESLNFVRNLNLPENFKNNFKFAPVDKVHYLNNFLKSSYSDKTHMIYKQTFKPKETEKDQPSKQAKGISEKVPKSSIKEVHKPIVKETLNPRDIEKKIMANTLGKREIVDLIKSYMSGINVEDISRNVLSRVESKILMSKKINGIF